MTKLPKSAQAVSMILHKYGVDDIENNVIPQLLEFSHRYTVEIIQDSLLYSEHGGKNKIDIDDLKLAIECKNKPSYVTTQQEMMLDLSREINSKPLPPVKDKFGIRLPPNKHILDSVDYQIVSNTNLDLDADVSNNDDSFMSVDNDK